MQLGTRSSNWMVKRLSVAFHSALGQHRVTTSVDALALELAEEAFCSGLIAVVANFTYVALMLLTMWWSFRNCWYSVLVNCVPRSKCKIIGLPVGCQSAIINAFSIKYRSCMGDIDQPATLPEYRSTTAHRYGQASPVQIK